MLADPWPLISALISSTQLDVTVLGGLAGRGTAAKSGFCTTVAYSYVTVTTMFGGVAV
jgi:hypothetical protein